MSCSTPFYSKTAARSGHLIAGTDHSVPDLPQHELTVIAPVYGNSTTLHTLTERLHTALDPDDRDHIILFIDDASPDDAWCVIRELCILDPRVAAVRLERNSGQHRAIMAGLALARGQWVAVMDADLQDPPEALPQLLAQARSTQATVFAARTGAHQSRPRRIASTIYKTFLWLLTGAPRRCGTFFVVPCHIGEALTRYDVSHPQVVVMVCNASPRISVVPFTRRSREFGNTAYDLRRLLAAARNGVWCAIECRRGRRLSGTETRHRMLISEYAGQAWQSDSR